MKKFLKPYTTRYLINATTIELKTNRLIRILILLGIWSEREKVRKGCPPGYIVYYDFERELVTQIFEKSNGVIPGVGITR